MKPFTDYTDYVNGFILELNSYADLLQLTYNNNSNVSITPLICYTNEIARVINHSLI